MFHAVAAIRIELPFLLRLPPNAFNCWEPIDGIAALFPIADVGELTWCRQSEWLRPEHIGLCSISEGDGAPTSHDYMIRAPLSSGGSLYQGSVRGGSRGGFSEPRPYSVVTLFVCLRDTVDATNDATLNRAVRALNNVIALYRFELFDALARPIRGLDAIFAVTSVARLPAHLQGAAASDILGRIPELAFSNEIGNGRSHRLGLNSLDDLLHPRRLTESRLEDFASRIQQQVEVELHHELFLSAVRRCRRAEHALAIMDDQSAFEVFVATSLRAALKSEGQCDADIDEAFRDPRRLGNLKPRLEQMDAFVMRHAPTGVTLKMFLGSAEEKYWRSNLYSLRNRIAHGGVRDIAFEDAKRGIVAGLKAVASIERLDPCFVRSLSWPESELELDWLREMPGSLFRLYHF